MVCSSGMCNCDSQWATDPPGHLGEVCGGIHFRRWQMPESGAFSVRPSSQRSLLQGQPTLSDQSSISPAIHGTAWQKSESTYYSRRGTCSRFIPDTKHHEQTPDHTTHISFGSLSPLRHHHCQRAAFRPPGSIPAPSTTWSLAASTPPSLPPSSPPALGRRLAFYTLRSVAYVGRSASATSRPWCPRLRHLSNQARARQHGRRASTCRPPGLYGSGGVGTNCLCIPTDRPNRALIAGQPNTSIKGLGTFTSYCIQGKTTTIIAECRTTIMASSGNLGVCEYSSCIAACLGDDTTGS